MDMREMVDKVKRGEKLYGQSTLSPYMQGVAARNSRYSGVFLHLMPWFNFVNHEQVCTIGPPFPSLTDTLFPQHGVDTKKYYQQAERELAAEQAQQSENS